MIEYKITLKSHIKHLVPLFIYVIVVVSIMLSGIINPTSDKCIMYVLYFILIVICGINMYLHLEYYFMNKGVRLYCNENKDVIKYIKGGKEKIITPNSINKIELYKSHYSERRSYASDSISYYFYKIILKDNDCIIITSLLQPDFTCFFKEKEVKKKVIASIYFSK